ncbi:MAG TPA: hypothetical protein VFP85_12505 [Vicinamibacterales bacterium]|nr:hypothetical protein [Vicinamibacterales bacterium]
MKLFTIVLLVALTIAAEPGKAVGSFTYDGNTVTLAHAVEARVEGLFDSSKQDLIVVLSDKPLGATAPGDDVDLSLRARKGELGALMLRIDGAKLVNVSVFHKGLSGKALLPGAWFDYKASKPGTGTLKLAPRDFDGHKYATSVEFASIAAPKAAAPAAAATPPPSAGPKPAEKPLPPATTSNIDTKSANALLVQAMMEKDERRALEIIKLGADPNGKDQYGVPMLSWAVMMCQPQVVQALVDRKANVNYSRAPGMTVLAEAGACPAAQKILKAAGAK